MGQVILQRFRTKMLAFGALKKSCDLSLLNDLDITPGSPDEKKNTELQTDAWRYLMIVFNGAALQLVDSIDPQSPFKTWEMLCQRYDPNDVEAYARLNQGFSFCT